MSVSASVAQMILYAIIVAALAALIVMVYKIIIANKGFQVPKPIQIPETDLAQSSEEAELVAAGNFDALMALALKKAQDGDYRSAYRLAYLAALVFLSSIGAIKLKRSMTNWEYLATLASTSRRNAMLEPTRLFDGIWYGMAPATRADFEYVKSSFESLKSSSEDKAG